MKNFSINARIKAVRKKNGLKQAEFGKLIGLTQGGVSYIEQGGNPITEQNIIIICQKFRVRREWLETGEGEMFNDGEPGIFAEFAKVYQLSLPEQHLTRYLVHLSHSEREQILSLLEHMCQALQEGRRLEQAEHEKKLWKVAESPAPYDTDK
ncbi:MAG: helix-turn-helix domain-containing protein [Anaerolineaceae bacterium]|nr:helix-turn-helix domain-containing protein [Anaerolineaceae bacterium]